MSLDVNKFLESVYAEKEKDDAIDLVMDTISDLLDGLDWKQFNDTMESYGGPRIFEDSVGDPKYHTVDEILAAADPWQMDDSVTLSFIVMTFQHKERYTEYKAFTERTRKRFLETGSRRRAKALLKSFT